MKKIAVASAVALATAGLVTGVLMAGGAATAKPGAVDVKPVGAVAQTVDQREHAIGGLRERINGIDGIEEHAVEALSDELTR